MNQEKGVELALFFNVCISRDSDTTINRDVIFKLSKTLLNDYGLNVSE